MNTYYPFALILFIAVSFPYVSIINTPFDTQPYAVTISTVGLFLLLMLKRDIIIPKTLIPFLIVLLYAFLRFIMHLDISALRSLIGYISIFAIALAAFYTFKYVKGRYFIYSVWVWFIFGVIQAVFSRSFGDFLTARMSTSLDRGVTSLAVEPSYYAFVCIFFFILNDVFYAKEAYRKKTHSLVFVLLIIQLFLSQSTLGFIVFGFYLFSRFLFSRGIKRKTLSFFGIGLTIAIVYFLVTNVPILQQSRFRNLVIRASVDPMNIVYHDGSVADRLSHIMVSFVSLFYNYGFGYGLATWDYYAHDIAATSGNFIYEVSQVRFTLGRIMSGWGTAVFELGIIGALVPLTFIYIMYRGLKRVDENMRYVYKVSLFTIFFLMLMAVPLAFPLFGYFIGVFVYLQFNNQVQKRGNIGSLSNGVGEKF